ncbi:peptidoglycan-binding protein [Thalassobaculum sp. OXR-137]|uniref:MORN repeat-containing protein n=1 Tax=Thalassobaculum sp. OXR-137 TaxID=3100173 RepID=UPI002AC9D6CC|nr:peptidoglycan-binding protein [Thalassobaculum sp. OXR-137]WPZ36983.1 peptidoglycan-binding protein [Thalassobaculum sp. OXR-137]
MRTLAGVGLALMLVAPQVAAAQSVEDIKAAQQGLIDYAIDLPAGVWEDDSKAALSAYQRDWQLPVTGQLTADMVLRLTGEHPATRAQWSETDRTGCEIWNAGPGARETYRWSGACRNGKADGQGQLTWRYVLNGAWQQDSYEGGFQAGRLHGQGVYTWVSGDRYEGGFSDGMATGRGVFSFADGSRYEGDWRDSDFNGRGVFTDGAGYRYEGDFKDGKQSGQGVATFANGYRYEGDWRDDDFNGRGVLTSPNGDRYEGDFRHGDYNGRGTYIFANGNRCAGEWRNDRLIGIGQGTDAGRDTTCRSGEGSGLKFD